MVSALPTSGQSLPDATGITLDELVPERPADEVSEEKLISLAVKIKAEHTSYHHHCRVALAHAHLCGIYCSEAKELLPHGDYLPWLERNCGVGARQASNYVTLAKGWELIPKSEVDSDLTITRALELIREADERAKERKAKKAAAPKLVNVSAEIDKASKVLKVHPELAATTDTIADLPAVTDDELLDGHPTRCIKGGDHEWDSDANGTFCAKCKVDRHQIDLEAIANKLTSDNGDLPNVEALSMAIVLIDGTKGANLASRKKDDRHLAGLHQTGAQTVNYIFEALRDRAFPCLPQSEEITSRARECLARIARVVDELASMEEAELAKKAAAQTWRTH